VAKSLPVASHAGPGRRAQESVTLEPERNRFIAPPGLRPGAPTPQSSDSPCLPRPHPRRPERAGVRLSLGL